MPTQGGPSWYVVVNDGIVEDDRYHYQTALINFLNGYQIMMSRKGGFPPKKRKCPFRCSWRRRCIDISNRVTLALGWSILCGEKWNKNRRPKRHRSSVKGDMYKIHSRKYSHLYIKLSLNTCRWDGLCDEKGGYTNWLPQFAPCWLYNTVAQFGKCFSPGLCVRMKRGVMHETSTNLTLPMPSADLRTAHHMLKVATFSRMSPRVAFLALRPHVVKQCPCLLRWHRF